MGYMLFRIVDMAVYVLQVVLFIRVILSWLAPTTRNDFTDVVYAITEPMLKPFRMILPIGYSRLDISPILAYFALNLIRRLAIMLLF